MYHLGFCDENYFLLFLLLTLPLMFLYLLKWFSSSYNKNLPPSPPKLPIIGNLHQLIMSTSTAPERCLELLARKYGSVMLLHLGGRPVVVISSADAAKQVLEQNLQTFVERSEPKFVARLTYNFRDVAFAPYGEYWRQVRNLSLLHLLSNKMADKHYLRNQKIREEETVKMLDGIQQSCASSGSVICMSDILTTLTSNIIGIAVTGKKCLEEIDRRKLKQLTADATMIAQYFNVADYIPWLGWINHFNGLEAKVRRVEKECHAYLDDIVEEGLKRVEKIMVNSDDQNIVDVLLDAHRGNAATGFSIDLDSIKAVVADMLLGGTANISLFLENIIVELFRNPSVMAKLQNEVRRFPEYHRKLNLRIIKEDDLEKLAYLKAVVKETLRFNPPVPLYTRQSQKPVQIQGYDVAPETSVVINAWAIGRNPKLWENADQFLPERFLNRNPDCDFKGKHFEFIPFGSGLRSCPGIGFTIPTVELALANLILNFDIETPRGAMGLEGLELRRKIPLLLVASLPN